MIYKITINTTTRDSKSVKLIKSVSPDDEKILDELSGDIDVIGAIYELLQKHKLDISDIAEFIPNRGPGSFTGIKTGITITNVLNWASGKKSIEELDMPNYGSEPNITPRKEL